MLKEIGLSAALAITSPTTISREPFPIQFSKNTTTTVSEENQRIALTTKYMETGLKELKKELATKNTVSMFRGMCVRLVTGDAIDIVIMDPIVYVKKLVGGEFTFFPTIRPSVPTDLGPQLEKGPYQVLYYEAGGHNADPKRTYGNLIDVSIYDTSATSGYKKNVRVTPRKDKEGNWQLFDPTNARASQTLAVKSSFFENGGDLGELCKYVRAQ